MQQVLDISLAVLQSFKLRHLKDSLLIAHKIHYVKACGCLICAEAEQKASAPKTKLQEFQEAAARSNAIRAARALAKKNKAANKGANAAAVLHKQERQYILLRKAYEQDCAWSIPLETDLWVRNSSH